MPSPNLPSPNLPGRSRSLRPSVAALALLCLLAAGCRHTRRSTSAPNTADYADNIKTLVASPQLAILRWPNYSDYQPAVATFYDDRNYELAWLRDLKPTPETTAFLQAFAGRRRQRASTPRTTTPPAGPRA